MHTKNRFLSILLALALVLGLLPWTVLPARAAETIHAVFTATDGTPGASLDEGYAKLVDGKFDPGGENTKWCVTNFACAFIEFRSDSPIAPTGYILTTGGDTADYPGRNPASWVIKAKAKPGDDWTTLAEVVGNTVLGAKSNADYRFALNNSTAYLYFRLEINSIRSGNVFQLAEFRFISGVDLYHDLAYGTLTGTTLYEHTGSAITPVYTVKAADGTELKKNMHYTVTITKGGQPVDAVTEAGDYVLTVTGIAPFTGSKELAFTVKNIPTTIGSADDWVRFAEAVKTGTDYSGMTVTLTDDIEVSTMVGDASHKFAGTFNGGGHTLTFNAETTADNCAPFGYIDGATIKYLNVAGAISTDKKYAAGVAAHSYGDCVIQGCRSSIAITSTVSGDGTHAGFVAVEESGTLNITNCLFDGSITGEITTNCGGFVGWRNGTLSFNNCLQNGALSLEEESGSATFNRNGSATLNNCYYKTAYGDVQGTQTSATGSDLQALLGSGWQVSGGSAVPVTDPRSLSLATVSGIESAYLYTDGEIAIRYTVKAADGTTLVKGTHYTETITKSGNTVQTVQAKGDYTLTITGKSPYSGSQTFRFTVTDGTPVTSETIAMTTGTYKVTENVTISARITVIGTVTLHLGANCTLTAARGIQVGSGNTLIIEGAGTLTATANNNEAGIGGNDDETCGTVTIAGGTVNATGGMNAAGIGGAGRGDGGTVTITGGTVTATGDEGAAGIGKGSYKYAGNGSLTVGSGLTVCGGSAPDPTKIVTDLSVRPRYMRVFSDRNFANVVVSGMKKYYRYTGEAINVAYTVTGTGGTPLAEGTDYTATITKGGKTVTTVQDKGDYTLTLTALDSGDYTGEQTFCFTVTDAIPVTTSTKTLNGGEFTFYRASGNVTVTSRISVTGTVELILDAGATLTVHGGIQVPEGASLTISGAGALTINDVDEDNAGIGGGDECDPCGTVTITGGTVTVTGGTYAAGIGGGDFGSGGTVTITGGTVTATGGWHGAGIGGGGGLGAGGTVTITGGTVTATGGEGAAGIGAGEGGKDNGSLTVGEGCVAKGSGDGTSVWTPVSAPGTYRYFKVQPAVTITFLPNGGTGESAAQKVFKGESETLTASGFTREGYAFAGWNTAADGSGTPYADGASVELTVDVTLYAQWEVVPSLAGGKVSAPAGARLVCATYSGGKMTGVQTVEIKAEYVNKPLADIPGVTAPAAGTAYKLFLLGGETYAPLCAAWDSTGN